MLRIPSQIENMFETHIEDLVRQDHPYHKLLYTSRSKNLYFVKIGGSDLVLSKQSPKSDRSDAEKIKDENGDKEKINF